MKNRKLWEGEDLEMESQEDPKAEPKAEYEVMKPFTHGKEKILPGSEVPKDLSAAALGSLIRKGVLRPL